MRFYTFGLAFFLSLPFAFAQSDTVESKNYILSKIIETINIQSKGYYLLKINDLRTSKNNLGTIKIKKVKQIVSTDDSLPQYLFNAFYPNSQIDSITKPLIINIEKLKTFGSSNGTIDQAELYIKLYVQTFQNNNLVTVHTFERTFNYQKKARPEFLKKFIFNSLATSISNLPLEIQNSKTNSQKVSDPKIQSAIENTHTIPISNSFKFSHLKYKINEIIDERTDTSNVGNVYVGYFNRNAKARLDSGLKTFLKHYLVSDSITNKIPASIHIYNFRCQENLTNDNEKAQFSFTANITIDSLGQKYIIHTSNILFDTVADRDITKLWPQVIGQGLRKYFSNFPTEDSLLLSKANTQVFTNETTINQALTKKYYYQDAEFKKLRDFNSVFSNSKDDSLKLFYNRSKIFIRTGRSFIGVGSAMLFLPLLDFMRSEQKNLKQWYNDENSNTNGTVWFGKKVLVNGGVATIATGFILKWIGKGLLTKAINRHNNSVFKSLSFDLNPNINNSGYSFKLGILISKAN